MKSKCWIKKILIAVAISIICLPSIAQEMQKKNVINQENETIRIAEILAITGQASVSQSFQSQLVRFAVKEINARGGILGKKIELLQIDNQSTALGSKLAAQKAIELGVVAVIGPGWSSHSLGAAPVLQKAKIPMITPGATNPNVTLAGDYIFRACFTDQFQGEIMAAFAIEDLNAKTSVVLTNVGNIYSIGLANYFKNSFEKQGGKVIWEGDYAASDTNFSAQLKKIKELKPDIIFVPGYDRDSGFIMKQARKIGVSAVFLGGDGWNSASMYKYGGDAINGNFFCSHWHKSNPRKISKDFVKRFEKEHGEFYVAPMGYDSVLLLESAIKRAKSTDSQKIQKALITTKNFAGVTGNYTFDAKGDPINKTIIILKFENGKAVYVKAVNP